MRIEESLNVIFDESPPPKSSPLVFKNKLDENDVVSRNKARLVAQEYNQQEGIDFDETYAPVARLESIRILLAYACAHDFKLFQIDVKSAFLNGFINEEVYVSQPPDFVDFENPNHAYKLKKALYGLKQVPKAWYDRLNQSKYIKEMLKKFVLEDSKLIKTSMLSETKLTRDEDEESVDDTKYRAMIGTGVETIVYADSDHAGDYVDRKTTDYQSASPITPINSPTPSPIASLGFSPKHLLNTPKSITPSPAPSQPFKHNSPLAIKLEHVELIFSIPPTSPHLFFDSLEDLPPRATNPPPPQPLFKSIKRLAKQPPPILVMKPPLPPLPPQLPPVGSNNAFPILTHEMFCEHCQRTQVLVNDLREEMRFILNHILERLNILAHQNLPHISLM
uniref:Copia protein n=1 Tax=Tanacetum cinerariifolium TaxID=118510 RepID=A0A6L2M8V4_TANCI|nr:copia protein [Tanacetum cinerariifolium]